jgi:2-keto-4-pentenoate hydratase/2-oxohepta-3-ene-1,7-dioic acid hydratase in catechol pathway
MKLVTFTTDGSQRRLGALAADRVIDLCATDGLLPATLRGLIAAGPEALCAAVGAAQSAKAVVARGVRLVAPIDDPEKVICIGLNYRDHAAESGVEPPREPIVFSKFASALIGPDEEIRLPGVSNQVDYEAELVVVLGRGGRDIDERDALAHVFGYTVGNDVSARDWQLQKDGRQWLLGKTFDTFAPIGPAIVSRDEVDDPQRLAVELRLNGQVMQRSSTAQMIFSVARLIAYISQVVTFEPGDLIFTGTPPGVGMARKPPVFLKPGDVCEVEIERLGVLRNRCVLPTGIQAHTSTTA